MFGPLGRTSGGDVLKAPPSRRRAPTQSRCKPAFPEEAGSFWPEKPASLAKSRLLSWPKKSRLSRRKPALSGQSRLPSGQKEPAFLARKKPAFLAKRAGFFWPEK